MYSTILVPKGDKIVVCIVFHGDSLERIQGADPAVIEGDKVTKLFKNMDIARVFPFSEIDILIGYERDPIAFEERCKQLGNLTAILHYVGRNWNVRPGEADSKVERIPLGFKS